MDGKGRREKGRRAERELEELAALELGSKNVVRNFGQAREGGADLVLCDHWAVEVKAQVGCRLVSWWAQAVGQCKGRVPVVVWKPLRRPWRVFLALPDVVETGAVPTWGRQYEYLVEMSLDAFFYLVRERVS